jgi:hypothetical protein
MDRTSMIARISPLIVQLCSPSATGASPHDSAKSPLLSQKDGSFPVHFGPSFEEKQHMEGIGGVANIAQLICLTISTAQEVCSIFHSLKSFPQELESISNEVTAFSHVLNALHVRVGELQSIHSSSIDSQASKQSDDTSQSKLLFELIASSRGVLLKIQRLLPHSQVKNPNWVVNVFKAIVWHVKSQILQKALSQLERHKSTLQLLLDDFDR